MAVERAPILPLRLAGIRLTQAGKTVLDKVDLEIDAGGPTIILGPNGAGKTMLLRICHGLIVPDGGSVIWHNPVAAALPSAQGMVFQQPVMFRRSVRANIEFALQSSAVDKSLQKDRLRSALEISSLQNQAEQMATRLSGGEQQRLALARCWAIQPRVLFLDEPTAHLDPAATRQVENLIMKIRDAGCKIVMVTHDIGQARRLGDHIVFMHGGRVLEAAASDRFFNAPDSEQAAAFVRGELLA